VEGRAPLGCDVNAVAEGTVLKDAELGDAVRAWSCEGAAVFDGDPVRASDRVGAKVATSGRLLGCRDSAAVGAPLLSWTVGPVPVTDGISVGAIVV
jgi:hypothetical protein